MKEDDPQSELVDRLVQIAGEPSTFSQLHKFDALQQLVWNVLQEEGVMVTIYQRKEAPVVTVTIQLGTKTVRAFSIYRTDYESNPNT